MNDDIRPTAGGNDVPHMPVSEQPRLTHSLTPHHPAAFDPKNPPKQQKGPFKKLRRWFHHLSKKQKIILISVLVGLLIASGLIWWFVFRGQAGPENRPVVKEEPEKPTTGPRCLSGQQVALAEVEAPVTGIMIENSTAARPQSGLSGADIVFEAIAEGGITRFLALYQDASPEYIGPVRSLRPYYLDFMTPFTNAIAHAGGSGQALAEVRNGYRDIEAFRHPGAFQRISSRRSPHNLYTNRGSLVDVQKSLGPETSCKGFKHAEKADPAQTPSANSIDIRISSPTYNVHFDYDAATNSYLRSMAGHPHIDERANQQIAVKAVVVPVMSHHYAGVYSVYGVHGNGTAFIFQDGKVDKVTWTKNDRAGQFIFKHSSGKEFEFTPGKKWISIVSSPDAVTHQGPPAPTTQQN